MIMKIPFLCTLLVGVSHFTMRVQGLGVSSSAGSENEILDRLLQQSDEEEDSGPPPLWQTIYMAGVLCFMFGALLLDKIGADWVMIMTLTFCMVAGLITVKEGLEGFSNEGVMTVLALFVVAAGISHTGALDWYMGKLLGKPRNIADAQLRIFVPITFLSGFLNNTPLVVLMIPIIMKWSKNIGVSPKQLLIPLSFASILGGTCTLIGTSTNLVVYGLLKEDYPDVASKISLFSLALYGIPVALAGGAYILGFSQCLIPGANTKSDNKGEDGSSSESTDAEDVLIGARITAWSPASGRSIKRSGLRDTGGIYLVSVKRATTGNVHRAVGQEFVLQTGDICYFTTSGCNVNEFGHFCHEHCLTLVTNDDENHQDDKNVEVDDIQPYSFSSSSALSSMDIVSSDISSELKAIKSSGKSKTIGLTKESLVQSSYDDRLFVLNRMSDYINNRLPSSVCPETGTILDAEIATGTEPPQILVASEPSTARADREDHPLLIVIGVNCMDRPGVLRTISKTLHDVMNLTVHHTEASVCGLRSISIWRCEESKPTKGNDTKTSPSAKLLNPENVWSTMVSALVRSSGVEAVKERGVSVIRATVLPGSFLIGKSAKDVNFRARYGASIVTIQRNGKNIVSSPGELTPFQSIKFMPNDMLILQVDSSSSLLHSSSSGAEESNGQDNQGVTTQPQGQQDDETSTMEAGGTQLFDDIKKDLKVLNRDNDTEEGANESSIPREYLAAMRVSTSSSLAKKSAEASGLTTLPGLVLVSIERRREAQPALDSHDIESIVSGVTSTADGDNNNRSNMLSIDIDENLMPGDVLWFAGSATALRDLRKIPGLVSNLKEELSKLNDKPQSRKLVQAVISGQSNLIGKTAAETQFRTKFGAAIIAIHRDGKRVQEHPGRVVLHGGDVLLLEAGPTFMAKTHGDGGTNRSFVLVSEVENSTPPRLRMFVPALVLTVTMIAVASFGVISLLVAAILTAMLMVMLGIMSQQEARDSINWDVFITIASAFGIGTAMENSGLSTLVADVLVNLGSKMGIGNAGLYGAVYLATFLISNVVTNNAAAALIFPIGMEAAIKGGANPVQMSYCIMLSASASFMSPFGYTTNLLIYGPGNYKFMDFVKFGTPMQVILWLLTTVILSASTNLAYLSWAITGGIFIAVGAIMSLNCFGSKTGRGGNCLSGFTKNGKAPSSSTQVEDYDFSPNKM